MDSVSCHFLLPYRQCPLRCRQQFRYLACWAKHSRYWWRWCYVAGSHYLFGYCTATKAPCLLQFCAGMWLLYWLQLPRCFLPLRYSVLPVSCFALFNVSSRISHNLGCPSEVLTSIGNSLHGRQEPSQDRLLAVPLPKKQHGDGSSTSTSPSASLG